MLCPACKHENPVGILQCEMCGVSLVEGTETEHIEVSAQEIGGIPTESLDPSILEKGLSGRRNFGLRHVESGKLFDFPNAGSFILGRVSEGQSILPDVDFAPIQGFEAGVSRLHALVSISGEGMFLTDLGSSNGTLVNGKAIPDKVKQKIENGDKIQLGRLKIEAIVEIDQ